MYRSFAFRATMVIAVAFQATPALATISLAFTTPSANSNYASGSPIGYGGTVNLTAPERPCDRIMVQLVYSTGSNPPPGTGVVLDESEAIRTPWQYQPSPTNWTSADATWASPTPNDLNALQYQGHTTGYTLRAIPYWKTSIPYRNPDNSIYFAAIALGQITA